MIGVPRLGASPSRWRVSVDKSLPDAIQFWLQGAVFEALPLGDAVRVAGFYVFAPALLVARKKGGKAKLEFPDVWNRLGVRTQLIVLARKKCVYCESAPTDREKQIDHFQPKKLFPTLAYDLWNLFLSCGSCNVAKLDCWPAVGGYVRPDEGEPAARFVFTEDGAMTAVLGDTEAEATVMDFGLDRAEYRERRELVIARRLEGVRRILSMSIDVALKREFVKTHLAKTDESYSEAINQCVRRAWDGAFPGILLG